LITNIDACDNIFPHKITFTFTGPGLKKQGSNPRISHVNTEA